MALNPEKIRQDFPILKRKINGKALVYLDNAATTQKPAVVMDAERDFYENHNANVHRGRYLLSDEASELYENAHATVGKFVGANPEETVFCSNTTEAINVLAYSLVRGGVLKKGDTVLSSVMEHHANMVPWIQLKEYNGVNLEFIPLNAQKTDFDLEKTKALIQKHKPKVVSVSLCSNVLGTVTEIKEIVKLCHDAGALVIGDAAQAVPHTPINFKKLDLDFLAFSGHKMLGPTGIGVMIGKREHLEKLPPAITGGHMISEVFLDKATWNELPWKWEAGTLHISGGIGLAAAVDYLNVLGMENVHAFEQKIGQQVFDALSELNGITLYGPKPEKKCALFSFNIKGVHPHDAATVLDSEGICVRSGNHCAQPLLRELGVDTTLRASFYVYNTESEIDSLVNGIKKAQKTFGV